MTELRGEPTGERRPEFEAFAARCGFKCVWAADGMPDDRDTYHAWLGWSARAAHPPSVMGADPAPEPADDDPDVLAGSRAFERAFARAGIPLVPLSERADPAGVPEPFPYEPAEPSDEARRAWKAHYGPEFNTADANRSFDEFFAGWYAARQPSTLAAPAVPAAQDERLRKAAQALLDACFAADMAGDLAGEVDGSLMEELDAALNAKPQAPVMGADVVEPHFAQGHPAVQASGEKTLPCHTEHPARHWDRTCPACLDESEQETGCRIYGSANTP